MEPTTLPGLIQTNLESILGGFLYSLIHRGILYHSRAGMPVGYRHLQALLSLTLKVAANPTDYLCKPVSDLMFHLAWPFIVPSSITILCVASTVMYCYGNLCAQSRSLTSADIQRILTPLNHRTSKSSIFSQRAHNVVKILLLCDFRLG